MNKEKAEELPFTREESGFMYDFVKNFREFVGKEFPVSVTREGRTIIAGLKEKGIEMRLSIK